MLALTRKRNERIVIGDQISIKVLEVRGTRVRLGVEAPDDVTVHRQEVAHAIADCRVSRYANQADGGFNDVKV